jgi:magnesium-transporting ATPase (P-type)
MDKPDLDRREKSLLWLGLILAALATVAAIVAGWWRRHSRLGQPAALRRVPLDQTRLPLRQLPAGLTEEDAAARWSESQDNTVHLKPRRTRQQIWQGNIYTIFNLNLVGLATVQLLLARWLDALLSLGTLALSVGLNVGQEMLALRRLAAFQRSARPKATVVREGKARSIDPNRVVPGDVLIVGPGDQFLVDGRVAGPGRMVVDESAVTGKWGWQRVGAGDQVYAGSFCISSRGAYVAEKVGDERFIVSHVAGMPATARGAGGRTELTPLERVVDRILRVLLVLVAALAALLLAAFFRLDLGIPVEMINDAASVIFRIAPSGLFLMIIVTYTTGAADLVRRGALVHRARSVESLAEATVICFTEVGILAGTSMEMIPLPRPAVGDAEPLGESRLRQILGDYARSTSAPNPVTRILANSFEGNRRAMREEAPFLAALGWSAFTFEDRDVEGVYVLGEPHDLASHLVAAGEQAGKGATRSRATIVQRLLSPLGRLRKHTTPEPGEQAVEAVIATAADQVNGAQSPETAEGRALFPRRWAHRIRQILRRTRRQEEQAEASEGTAAPPEVVLLFAYHPEPWSLYDAQGNVQLPRDLVPLCELHYTRRLRPEAIQVMRGFAQAGVGIKVFASDEPVRVLAMLRDAGLRREDEDRLLAMGTISGRTLEGLPAAEWERAALENSLFGGLTPAQAGTLVRALRESGESVAVVGDGVTDLPALQEGSLAIARQTGTQAALGVADIVLLDNSPKVLLQVLYRGQAIVHGLLDVLKLNLTEVVCLALLIVAIQAVSVGFPHVAAQGTAIAVITVAIPSVGLSFWATSGAVSSAQLGRILARFVAPAAVSMSVAALLVYLHFLDQTGRVAYAQLAVTYTLIYTGLLLVVFVKPPRLTWNTGQRRSRMIKQEEAPTRDWRMTGLVLLLGIATFFLPAIPAAQRHLRLDWLQQPADYGVVGLAVLVWALTLSFFWSLILPVDAQGVWSGSRWAPPRFLTARKELS